MLACVIQDDEKRERREEMRMNLSVAASRLRDARALFARASGNEDGFSFLDPVDAFTILAPLSREDENVARGLRTVAIRFLDAVMALCAKTERT